MWHILFDEMAAGALQYALPEAQLITFPNHFGEGPITALQTSEGLMARAKWLEDAYYIDSKKYERAFKTSVKALLSLRDEEVVVWTSNNAGEQIGLRVVSRLIDDSCNIYVCNTAHNVHQIQVRHSGEVSPKQLHEMFAARLFSQLDKDVLKQEAAQLLESTAIVRTFTNNCIVEDVETRDDHHILNTLAKMQEKGYVKAVRLISMVLVSETLNDINDKWIDYRIRQLIEEGRLESKGEIDEMQRYKVQLPQEKLLLSNKARSTAT